MQEGLARAYKTSGPAPQPQPPPPPQPQPPPPPRSGRRPTVDRGPPRSAQAQATPRTRAGARRAAQAAQQKERMHKQKQQSDHFERNKLQYHVANALAVLRQWPDWFSEGNWEGTCDALTKLLFPGPGGDMVPADMVFLTAAAGCRLPPLFLPSRSCSCLLCVCFGAYFCKLTRLGRDQSALSRRRLKRTLRLTSFAPGLVATGASMRLG